MERRADIRLEAVSKAFGDQVASLVAQHRPNIVLSTSSIPVSQGGYPVPRFFYTDATLKLLGGYAGMDQLTDAAKREATEIERSALHNSSLSFYSSEWARESAIKDYDANPDRVRVVPFGANLDSPPESATVEASIAARSRTQLDLLFIGKEWDRKGGDKAVKVTQNLRDRGLDARLCILGTMPEGHESMPDWVTSLGFVSKKTAEGRARIGEIFGSQHFFLLPTKADCTPIVYAESSAYGLPSITHRVGGVSSMVEDGENGLLFAPDSAPSEMADAIEATFRDQARYEELCRSSRRRYETHLNWDSVAAELLRQIQATIG